MNRFPSSSHSPPSTDSPSTSSPSTSSSSNENSTRWSFLTRRRFLPLDPPTTTTTLTHNDRTVESNDRSVSTHPLEARRREREAQRDLMDVHRDTLRAAERTISLLREQIRLHDERARLSIASLVPLPAPAGTPARTPTQRAALERSLSSRIASLQADIERQQLRAGAVGLIRRPETEALLEERNLANPSRRSSQRVTHRLSNPNACPFVPGSSASHHHDLYSIRSSSDRWLSGGGRPSRETASPSSTSISSRRSPSIDFPAHQPIPSTSPSSSFSTADYCSLQKAMEREWERQLADGEVDSNGVPILPSDHQDHSDLEGHNRCSRSIMMTTTTTRTNLSSLPRANLIHHLGRRKVDGLGLQLALASASSFESDHSHKSQSNSLASYSFHPTCLR